MNKRDISLQNRAEPRTFNEKHRSQFYKPPFVTFAGKKTEKKREKKKEKKREAN